VLTERDCQDARLLAPYEPTQLTVLRASLDPHLTASDAAALLQDLRPSVLLVRNPTSSNYVVLDHLVRLPTLPVPLLARQHRHRCHCQPLLAPPGRGLTPMHCGG
jgi:hypothetical protein